MEILAGGHPMKSRFIQVVALAALALLTVQAGAQNPNNPLDVALLRWYGGNISVLLTTDLGPYPDWLAFGQIYG
jgi:hypothetical protein